MLRNKSALDSRIFDFRDIFKIQIGVKIQIHPSTSFSPYGPAIAATGFDSGADPLGAATATDLGLAAETGGCDDVWREGVGPISRPLINLFKSKALVEDRLSFAEHHVGFLINGNHTKFKQFLFARWRGVER